MSLSKKERKELLEELKQELYGAKEIIVETCREDIKLPFHAHIGDAGMDICAADEILILPGETKIIPTGLKMVMNFKLDLEVVYH